MTSKASTTPAAAQDNVLTTLPAAMTGRASTAKAALGDKPVFAYIAGFSAPPGKTMGHAGAIISGSSGTAQAKKEALEAAGIQVGTTPTEVAQIVAERFGART